MWLNRNIYIDENGNNMNCKIITVGFCPNTVFSPYHDSLLPVMNTSSFDKLNKGQNNKLINSNSSNK